MWDEYVWIVVLGAFMAFFTAYGIGANDVANAFATSVGSKALTMTQAVIIGAVFEFLGAFLLGSQVTDTVRKKIADKNAFKDDPEVLMYGMLCVLFATGLWLVLATYLELPVSTTHSVIGGIIGMSLAAKGSDAVVWYNYDSGKEALKKFSGVVPVIISWVVSPVLSGCFAVILFFFVRTFILRQADSFRRSLIFFPFLVGVTLAVNLYFIIYKGFSRKVTINGEEKKLYEHLGPGWSSLIAWGIGGLVGLALWFTFVPWLRRKGLAIAQATGGESTKQVLDDAKPEGTKEGFEETDAKKKGAMQYFDRDLHDVIKTNEAVQAVHDNAEKFVPETENSFLYLQVFTAMCDSFAHGANDVANSIGPFAAIFSIYKEKKVDSKADVPLWILALGGLGIVVGLATYGHNIIRAIGVKLVSVTPSRGFSIELGSASVIILGSRYGIPLSTTHCQVGATVGVGLLEGGKGVNGLLFLKVIGGWIMTLVVVGFTAAGFFAQAAYAPSIPNLNTITRYQDGIGEVTKSLSEALEDPSIQTASIDLIGGEVDGEEVSPDYTDISKPQVELLMSSVESLIGTCK